MQISGYPAKLEQFETDKQQGKDGPFLLSWEVSMYDFPEITCVGESKSEVLQNIRSALSCHIEYCYAHDKQYRLPPASIVRESGTVYIYLPMWITIPVLLRKLRGNRSLKSIAAKIGIATQTYQRLENPARCNPTLRTLEKLETAYGKVFDITVR
jgi:predicted RNase H-like HicB family nuclease/DNA-binding XRE family transcriptional regulator